MKTKLITLTVLLLSAFAMKAQQGEIVYNDYDPDSILVISNEGFMLIDLDGEGSPDIKMSYYTESPGAVFPFIESCYPDSIMVCATGQDSILSEIEEYSGNLGFEIVLTNHHYGFRIKHAEEYYYGWFETYLEWVGKDDRRVLLWGFDRIAFCTIPDYPLVWGQTELVSIDETVKNGFSVYPNPANDILFVETVHAPSLPDQTYRITNIMGQTLLQGSINAEIQQINIASLPAGLYFLSVGNTTQKFVKQ